MRRTHRAIQSHARSETDDVLEVGEEITLEAVQETVELTEDQRLEKIGEATRIYENTMRELGVIID